MKTRRGQASHWTPQQVLVERGRAVPQQSRAEKCPHEYGPLVERYLKNLSDKARQEWKAVWRRPRSRVIAIYG